MSSERRRRFPPDPFCATTTFVYDARGKHRGSQRRTETFCYEANGRHVDGPTPGQPGTPPPPAAPAAPLLRHSFEFRLCGSEIQEQARPRQPAWPVDCLLAAAEGERGRSSFHTRVGPSRPARQPYDFHLRWLR
jgi:hypothetical protein